MNGWRVCTRSESVPAVPASAISCSPATISKRRFRAAAASLIAAVPRLVLDLSMVRDRREGIAISSYPWPSVLPASNCVTLYSIFLADLIPAKIFLPVHSLQLSLEWFSDPINVDSNANEDNQLDDEQGEKY